MNMSKNYLSQSKFRSVAGRLVLVCTVAFLPLSRAFAATMALKNASFEEPALPGMGQQSTNVVPGWKVSGAAGVFANNGAYGNKMSEADGAQLAFLNGTQMSALAQDAAPRIEPLTAYTLTASVGLRKDTPLAKGGSLLLRLQSYDPATSNRFRTLAIKEVQVGREPLSDEKLAEFTATFTSGQIGRAHV